MSSSSQEKAEVRKLIIGLTGNIATGKSAVMRLAREMGALTIDADKVVHHIMDTDAEMQAAVAVAFGPEVRRKDGRIDRRKLGAIVFNDPSAMSDLEAMVHPAVRSYIARQIMETDADVVMIEAIKLLEGPLSKLCHQIWVTRCTKQKQLERLMVCRGMDAESAATRIRAQAPQEEKVALADVVIDTEGLMTDTEAQFALHWRRLPDPVTLPPLNLEAAASAPPPVKPKAHITPPSTPAAKPQAQKPPTAVSKPAKPMPKLTMKPPKTQVARPDDLQARRARPSDIPSILLLMQKATDGKVKMKRAELLMALSERSYVIGQVGAEISAVMGWSIDSQVARIDQIYLYPITADSATAVAILDEIEQSALQHLGEVIVAFLPEDAPPEMDALFEGQGYQPAEKTALPPAWQLAVEESQPENTRLMVRILDDYRLQASKD
jgi:dephospho-CoA kinase